MILVDANLLLYAANRDAPEHGLARMWLDERLNGMTRVGLPWPSLLAFARIASNPAFVRQPVTPADAWRQIRGWLLCQPAWVPLPGPSHAELLGRFLELSWMTTRLVPDAHLAALAIEHGAELRSTDRDFARFEGLSWDDPLV